MSSPKRALIVIDVQNEYFTGKLGISYPDPAITLPNVGRAMDAASAAGIPVVVVQHITPPGTPIFAEGSHGAALHPDIAARPHDHLISKQLASCFTGTDLADWLRARDIDTLSIVGYMTHNCDAATVLHASHDGWQVELLADASGSLPYRNRAGSASAEEIHRVFTVVMQTGFAAVVSTDDWIAAVAAGQPAGSTEGVLGSHLQAVAQ
ncbi:cysteine hydrolase family protein [Vogesella oryzae]|uniref:cysteine hydrolase family protein n=1 Tax=Vogesella oryzae TaxID=1735285 RepID=UPI001583680B|nr:cysteine hydrolase family protein [Vogesella oryzae]